MLMTVQLEDLSIISLLIDLPLEAVFDITNVCTENLDFMVVGKSQVFVGNVFTSIDDLIPVIPRKMLF